MEGCTAVVGRLGMWGSQCDKHALLPHCPTGDNRISAHPKCTTVHCNAANAQHSTQAAMLYSAVQWSAHMKYTGCNAVQCSAVECTYEVYM